MIVHSVFLAGFEKVQHPVDKVNETQPAQLNSLSQKILNFSVI